MEQSELESELESELFPDEDEAAVDSDELGMHRDFRTKAAIVNFCAGLV